MTAESKKVRVLLAEGRPLMRELLAATLSAARGFQICGTADSCGSAVEQASSQAPDVVLFGTPGLDAGAEEFVHSVLIACPSTAVMVLVPDDQDPELFAALDAGAIAFATCGMSLRELNRSLQAAAVHETVLPSDFARRVLNRLHTPSRPAFQRNDATRLTARETEILALLMQGQGNAEIARSLGVSINTVKNHLYSIYRKLGVTSRGQAFAAASQLGLVKV
jgi:DNA-binding NarL/FixJ family response regulator